MIEIELNRIKKNYGLKLNVAASPLDCPHTMVADKMKNIVQNHFLYVDFLLKNVTFILSFYLINTIACIVHR